MAIQKPLSSLYEITPMTVQSGAMTLKDIHEAYAAAPEVVGPFLDAIRWGQNQRTLDLLISEWGYTETVNDIVFLAGMHVKPETNFPIEYAAVLGMVGDQPSVAIGTSKRDLLSRGQFVTIQDPQSREQFLIKIIDDGQDVDGSVIAFKGIVTNLAGLTAPPATLTSALVVGNTFYREFKNSEEFGDSGQIPVRIRPLKQAFSTSIIRTELPVSRRLGVRKNKVTIKNPESGKVVAQFTMDEARMLTEADHSKSLENFAMTGMGYEKRGSANLSEVGYLGGGQLGLIDQIGMVNDFQQDVLTLDYLAGIAEDIAYELNGSGDQIEIAVLGSFKRSRQFSNAVATKALRETNGNAYAGVGNIKGATDMLSYTNFFERVNLGNGIILNFMPTQYFNDRQRTPYGNDDVLMIPLSVNGRSLKTLGRYNYVDSADIKFAETGSMDAMGNSKKSFADESGSARDGVNLHGISDVAFVNHFPTATARIRG